MKWDTAKELLHGALALEPAGRGAFLAERCRGDAALLAEVESLLGSYEEEPGFLETPARGPPAGGGPGRRGARPGAEPPAHPPRDRRRGGG